MLFDNKYKIITAQMLLFLFLSAHSIQSVNASANQKGLVKQAFSEWLDDLKVEALRKGIRSEIIESALSGVQLIPRVVELDRKQPEFNLTFRQYMDRVVPRSRVVKGRKMLSENRELLDEVSKKYGVQPRFIVALWGIETDFGRVTGGFKLIPALVRYSQQLQTK